MDLTKRTANIHEAIQTKNFETVNLTVASFTPAEVKQALHEKINNETAIQLVGILFELIKTNFSVDLLKFHFFRRSNSVFYTLLRCSCKELCLQLQNSPLSKAKML